MFFCLRNVRGRIGILDALVEHAVEHRGAGVADAVDIAQRQGAVGKLTILQLAAHKLDDKVLNRIGGRILHGAHRGLDGIAQQHDGAFTGGGRVAVIAVIGDIHGLAVGVFKRLGVEIHHRRIAMML